MSGSVWDKYKIPQDPSGNIPEADAVLPQRKPDDLPPAAQEKAEAEGRRETADKGLPKPAEVNPSGAPKYEKKVYTGGTDFKLERPDGTPIDVDLPKSPALIEDPDRPVKPADVPKAVYGSPAMAERLSPAQRDIRDTAVPTVGVYGSPAIAEREARLADEKAAKAAEAERKAQAEKPKAAKPASTAASPALADMASEPSTGWRESPASLRMKEEKYYPSPAQLTGFAVREAREKLTGKPLDVDGLMKRLEDAHRSFDNQLTYASPTTAQDIYARRKKAVEDAVAAHATAVGSTNRRALEMEAASRGIPLASMIEQYETDDKTTPRASDIVEATKRRGVDIERLNRLDDIGINWASFSPQIFTSSSTTGVLGNDETGKDVEIVKPGELGYEAALMVLNAVEEDGYNVGYITRLANERGGAQRWVEQRTADLTAGLTSADPQYDEKMGRAYQRAIAEIAAFKTVGLWASPVFMNDLIAPDYSKGLGDRLWDAVKNQREVIGYGPTSDPNKPRIITRARSAPATFFDAIDIPQQATVGFVEEIAKKGWDQADFAEGAVKGIEDKRDFMQAAVQSDWAKPTQVYDAFGQLKLDADGNPVMTGEWKPLVAGGLGFTASVLFPDLTLYAGKAVGVGTDAYKGLRDGRRLAEATNLVDSVIALRSEGAAALRHAEEMNKKFRDAIASGAPAAEVDKWRLAASDSRQLARAAFDEAAVQEAKLRSKYKMVAEDVDRTDAGVAADLAKDNPDIFNTRLAQAASQSDELLTLHPSMRRMKTKAPVVSDMRAKQPTELSTVDYEDLFNTSRIIGSIDQTLGETPSAEAVARVLRTTASNDVADIRRVIGDDDVAVQLLNDIEDTLPQAVADPKAWSRAILDRRNDLPSINPPDDAADAVKEAAKEKRKRLVRAVVNIYSKAKAAAKDASTDIRGRAIDAALTNNESRIAAASIMSERLRAMKGSKKSRLKNIQPDPTIDMALEKADYEASLTDGGLRFKKMLIDAGVSEKEAQIAAVVTDARARVASWKRGISTDEWYATRIEGVVKGDASKFTADTLYQESLAKNTDVSRLAVPEGFFSPLQRAIAKVIGDNNGRPVKSGYLLQQVKKQSGVKADELQWSGLEEFLVGKEKVSLEEVTEWLTTREPVVEVRGLGLSRQGSDDASYGYWVAPGPSENYREIRFIQPAIPHSGGTHNINLEPNAIAHLRTTDRVTEDGKKVLFVEEVQSDWHQAGAKEGYIDSALAKKYAEAELWFSSDEGKRLRKEWANYRFSPKYESYLPDDVRLGKRNGTSEEWRIARELTLADRPEFKKVFDTDAVLLEYEKIPQARVNSGAHAETWRELALKQALIIAAREGYDGVAMTRGPIIARVAGGSGVGGELPGQLAFYEEILPNTAASLAKKNGSRLETTRLNVGAVVDDEKVKELRQLQHYLSKSDDTKRFDALNAIEDDMSVSEEAEFLELSDKRAKALSRERLLSGNPFDTGVIDTEQMAWKKTDGGVSNVPYIPVTDAMKAKVESEGLPLFSRDTVSTPAFKKWFGDSKVVDAEGRPLVVYHGTTGDFDRMKGSKEGAFGSGIYLTEIADRASSYASGPGGNVIPAYVRIKNPLTVSPKYAGVDPVVSLLVKTGMDEKKASAMTEKAYEERGYIGKQLQSRAQAAGYDGVIVYNSKGEISELVVWNPAQVKSVHNSGAFNPQDPRLLYHSDAPVDDAYRQVLVDQIKADLASAKAARDKSTAAQDKLREIGAQAEASARLLVKDRRSAAYRRELTRIYNELNADGALHDVVQNAYADIQHAERAAGAHEAELVAENAKAIDAAGADTREKDPGFLDVLPLHAEDLVDDLIERATDDATKEVLKLIKPAVEHVGVGRLRGSHGGLFAASRRGTRKDLVLISESFVREGKYSIQTAQHELIHAATHTALHSDSGTEIYAELDELRALAHGQLHYPHGNAYGFTNVDEFVAEAFSNPEFQAKLKAMYISPLSRDDTQTVWSALIEKIARLFGVKKESNTAYNVLLNKLEELVEITVDEVVPKRAYYEFEFTPTEDLEYLKVELQNAKPTESNLAKADDVYAELAYRRQGSILESAVSRRYATGLDDARVLYSKDASTAARLVETHSGVVTGHGSEFMNRELLRGVTTAKEAAAMVYRTTRNPAYVHLSSGLMQLLDSDATFAIVNRAGKRSTAGNWRVARAENKRYYPDAVAVASSAGYVSTQTILHELVHSATSQLLHRAFPEPGFAERAVPLTKKQREAANGIKSCYEILQEELRKPGAAETLGLYADEATGFVSADQSYGFSDVHEFVAEAFTNPEFQAILARIPSREPKKSMWQELLSEIAKLLGQDTSEVSETLLNDVINYGSALMLNDIKGKNALRAKATEATKGNFFFSEDSSTAARLLEANTAVRSLTAELGASRKTLADAQNIASAYPSIEVYAMERVEESKVSAKTGDVVRTSHWRVVENPGRMSPRAFMLKDKNSDNAWLVPNAVRLERLSDDFDFSALKNKAPTAQYGSVHAPASGKYDAAAREYKTEKVGSLSDDARSSAIVAPSEPKKETEHVVTDSRSVEEATSAVAQPSSPTEYRRIEPPKAVWVTPPPWDGTRYPVAASASDGLSLSLGQVAERMRETTASAIAAPAKSVTEKVNISVAAGLLEANQRAADAKAEVDRLTDALDKTKKRADTVRKAIDATKKSKISPDRLRDSVVKLRAEAVALKSDIETIGEQLKAAKATHAEASKAATLAKKADEAADKVVVKADKKGESVPVTQARARLTAAKKEYNAAARQLAEAKIALADAVSSKAKPGDIKTLKLRVEAAAALEKAKGAVVESANNLLSKTLAGEAKAAPVTPTVQTTSPTTVKVAPGKPVTPTDATSAPLPAAHGTPMGGVAPAVKASPDAASAVSEDELYQYAVDFVSNEGKASTSMLQRHFKIGYNRAVAILDRMEKEGIVGNADNYPAPREVFGRKATRPTAKTTPVIVDDRATTPPKTLDVSTPSIEATAKMPVEVEEVDDAVDASRVAGSKAAPDAEVSAREVTRKPSGKFGLNDDEATVDAALNTRNDPTLTGAQKLPRGAVTFAEDGRAVIHAFEGANVETVMHEVGHIMRRDLDADEVDDVVTWMRAQTGDNSLDIVDGHMVSDSGADAIVTAEEVFAEGFVAYLRTGIAPTNNLQRAFDYMKTWLREIYKAVRGFFPTSVSKETGAMFEKLLSVEKSEEAMRKAMASGIDPKATPNIIKRVYKELIGPTLPQAPKTMDELAKAARASGLDVDAATLDDMMMRQGKIDFPHPVAGKATYTDEDLKRFQATIERARGAAREEARLKQALSGAHEAIVEETPTEALRNRVAGDRMGSAMARAATATFIGLDADFDLRALPTNIRAYIKVGARIVEAAYADGVKLLQERSPEKFRAWLTGRPTKFHNGRNAISSGYDYAGAVRSNLQLAFSTLTDEARAGAKVAMASAEKGAPAFIPERLRKANALAVNQTLYANNSDFIKQLGEVLGIPSDGARNDPRPMETVLTGALHRYAHPSPDIDSYAAVDDFLDIIEDTYGPDKAARVGLLIAGHGAGHKAIQKYYNLGVTVNPEEAQVFQSWLHAEKMSDADRAKALHTAEKFGLDPRFVPVSGQFGTIHVPEAARKRLAAAMAKPSQNSLHWLSSPNDIGRGIYKDDVKPGQLAYDGIGFFVRGLKAGMTRGNLLVSSWFNFANTIDRMNQVATKAGFGAAMATMTRVLAQDMLIFTPLVSRAADVGRRFGVFDADAIEAMRRVLSEGGDRMAVVVQKMALANSCSISTNKVLDGVDETVNLGGRWYNYKDLRQVYIDQGVASSYAGELENSIRKSIRPPDGLVEKLGDRLASYMEYVEEMHEGLAERERVGAMLTFIEMGASPEDAAKLAVAALFDYGSSVAQAERSAFLALFFPFWAFQKNANMFTMNSLLTPWGAYRVGVMRRAWEGSTEALSELIYGSVADPYGVDTEALGDVGRANYYALRAEIEAFYGGSERVPDDVVLALRHLFGQLPAYMMTDGKIQQLSEKLQNVVTLTSGSDRRTDPLTTHPAMLEIGEAYVPKPDPSKRAGYNRDRPTIAVTFPKTENMKRYLSLAGDDHPYVELMLPEQTIVAGLRHTLNLLAATVLLPQKLIAWADGAYTDDGVEKMWHGMDETYIAGPLTQVMDPDRSILLPEIAADFFGGEDPPPYRIAPVIGELMADLGLPLVKTDAVTDPFALGTDASPEAVAENAHLMGNPAWTGRPSSDKNVGIVSAPRYYVPGGVWATLCRRLSGFHDINRLLMSADESTLEGASGLRGDLIVAASIALGIQEAESTGVKTAAREEPRKPDDALNPNK